jgi:hypothetical protein
MSHPIWFELDPEHGVLELPQDALGQGIELHVVTDGVGSSIAWWEDDQGRWVGAVAVGLA